MSMTVAYNCDERYAGAFAVSILSLFECNKTIEELTVYLIDNGIGQNSMRKIQEIATMYHRKIIVVPMPDLETMVGMDVVIPTKSNRITSCGRLFVTSLLPHDIDKVIYFDSDTIFLNSIESLWNIDLGEYYAGMMADAQNSNYRSMLGIPANGIYYNSGVTLINMKLWRENHIEAKFMRYLQSQGGYIQWPDQGILNAVLDGRILCLPCKYNVHTALFSFSYDVLLRVKKPQWFYSKTVLENALKAPAIVHFTTTFSIPKRPWVEGCNHPYTSTFLKFRKMTPWGNEPLWKDERGTSSRLFYSLYAAYARFAPKWLYIWTTKLFYVNLQPLMFRIKKRRHMKKNLGGVIYPVNFRNFLLIILMCTLPEVSDTRGVVA